MPRLSNALYYDRHRFLRSAWLEFDSLYTVLLVHHQWELHAYYQPSKRLTKAELLHHRRAITAKQPSLAAKAKHFDFSTAASAWPMPLRQATKRSSEHQSPDCHGSES